MSKYYFLKVKEVVQETADTVSIHFWHPLNELIKYKPGQFLTVLLPQENDKKIRRSYSMSSSPYTDVSPAITVKKLPGGTASAFLADGLKEGDILEVMEPMGTFGIEPDADVSRTVVLVGAGSGITPLISIAKSILIVEPESQVILINANRRITDIIFRDQLDTLQQKYRSRFKVVHSLTMPPADWPGESGRLTKTRLLKILETADVPDYSQAVCFLCGPDLFMEEARQALTILGATQIFHESFTTLLKPAEPPAADETSSQATTRQITLHYEGQEYLLPVAPHQTILEAALERDIDLPYSCQAGMCTACLGRCLSGNVHLDEYDSLTEAEVKEGFILTCVAHPLSDDVVVEVE